MKSLNHTLRYEGATRAEVYDMLGTEAFRARVCEAQGVLRHDVTITHTGDGMQVKVDQLQRATGIPSFAKRFVGEEIPIVQEESWSSPTAAELTVTIPGKPGNMRGTVRLVERDGGVDQEVSADIRVDIPMVGGKVEGLISDLLKSALKAENRTGKTWLHAEDPRRR
jgi:hypothetical protein